MSSAIKKMMFGFCFLFCALDENKMTAKTANKNILLISNSFLKEGFHLYIYTTHKDGIHKNQFQTIIFSTLQLQNMRF